MSYNRFTMIQLKILTQGYIDTIQNDTGANRTVTNRKGIIYEYEDATPFPIADVNADDVAIVCTGKGLLQWEAREGYIVIIEVLYIKEVEGTILSHTAVVEQNIDIF